MKRIFVLCVSFFILGFSCFCRAGMFDFHGQASAWISAGDTGQAGIRYIPEVGLSRSFVGEKKLDALVSANLYTFAPYDSAEDIKDNATAKLYRSWIRYSAPRYELRGGLQKISFGPAKILRSLMWFDDLDPRDPLKLTDGVYALLGRYYFLNNANIWLWGLYGNKSLRGLDVFETERDRVEAGGRVQVPVPMGEVAFSYDNRGLDKKYWERKTVIPLSDGIQNRYAIDGSFDIGPGIWFEAVANEIKISSGNTAWDKYLTVGADYTFDIGPGIHILCEHFIKSADRELREAEKSARITALSMDFDISVLDKVTGILCYNWDEEKVYSYLSWQRTYDKWLVNLSFFSNPDTGEGIYSGTGILCLFSYNY